uniref:Orf147 n=1 Tax=Gracilaria vermiculophylla TaxID=2608709 RepID=A0A0F6N3L2_9FLOR|nr:orf147 [Gracilaria vermiculophylla]AHZ58197.1 orf147 [Gracilaria vermiculophylla]AHZ58222.1 orf147 [Gracilaria vermiculophylla]AXI97813.1 hypothetical protein [Gracilaria vermiculophylla]WDZ68091.1 hypothetical protein [Gracilaria vermiculophylla]
MNQPRLYYQYNSTDAFDFLDNNFSNTQNFLIFNFKQCLKIYSKVEKTQKKKHFQSNLLLEALSCQKLFVSHTQKRKLQFFLYKITIRKNKIFYFIETLLHSLFMIWQSTINTQKVKFPQLDFFFHKQIFNKLFLQTFTHNYFTIINK